MGVDQSFLPEFHCSFRDPFTVRRHGTTFALATYQRDHAIFSFVLIANKRECGCIIAQM